MYLSHLIYSIIRADHNLWQSVLSQCDAFPPTIHFQNFAYFRSWFDALFTVFQFIFPPLKSILFYVNRPPKQRTRVTRTVTFLLSYLKAKILSRYCSACPNAFSVALQLYFAYKLKRLSSNSLVIEGEMFTSFSLSSFPSIHSHAH